MIFSRPSTAPQTTGFNTLERFFRRLASKRALSIAAVGMLALTVRAALIPLLGIPEPLWIDEFSYPLAADTFAHGRFSNPTHPMWVHFGCLHITHHPT